MCSASQPSSRASTEAMRSAKAFLAEQRVAAVAAAVGPDRALLGEMDDVLLVRCCRARARPSGPARAGMPTECMHGHEVAVCPSTSSTARPMRVMMRMLTAT